MKYLIILSCILSYIALSQADCCSYNKGCYGGRCGGGGGYADAKIYGNLKYRSACMQSTGASSTDVDYVVNGNIDNVGGGGSCYAYCMLSHHHYASPALTYPLRTCNIRDYNGAYMIALNVNNLCHARRYIRSCRSYVHSL